MGLGAVKAKHGALLIKVLLERSNVNAAFLANVAIALRNGHDLGMALGLEEEGRVVADCGDRRQMVKKSQRPMKGRGYMGTAQSMSGAKRMLNHLRSRTVTKTLDDDALVLQAFGEARLCQHVRVAAGLADAIVDAET